MPITIVINNENNNWKRKTKQQIQEEWTKKREKGRKGGLKFPAAALFQRTQQQQQRQPLRTYCPLLVIFEGRFYQVEIIWLDQSLDIFQYGGISFFWLLNFLSNILNFNRVITQAKIANGRESAP